MVGYVLAVAEPRDARRKGRVVVMDGEGAYR
jgi:hypothetical protein